MKHKTIDFSNLVALGLRLDLFLVYFLNCVQKEGPSWTSGQAVHRMIWSNWTATPRAFLVRDHEPAWLVPLLTYSVRVIDDAMNGCSEAIALADSAGEPHGGIICNTICSSTVVAVFLSARTTTRIRASEVR